MSVRGWVQGCVWKSQGTELTADAILGATLLHIENPTDFDDEGGQVSVNGATYSYAAGALDDDAETLTLTSGLTAAAVIGDSAIPVSGGQPMQDVYLIVDLGDGEPVDIEVPWSQRDLWPEGDYDDAVQVVLSDDLETIETVPGRVPARDAAFSYAPRSATYWTSDLTISHATWTTLSANWFFADAAGDRVRFDSVTGRFIPEADGRYEIKFGATFAANAVGARAIRFHVWNIDGTDLGGSRNVRVAADNVGTIAIETNQEFPLYAGMGVALEVWQNSGGDLALKGSNVIGGATPLTDYSIRWVGPR